VVAALCCEIRDRSWDGSLDDVSSSRLQQISGSLMAGLETRIAKLEAAHAERDGVDSAALWALPFWSRLSAALSSGSLGGVEFLSRDEHSQFGRDRC
jgi:hypothetical protein